MKYIPISILEMNKYMYVCSRVGDVCIYVCNRYAMDGWMAVKMDVFGYEHFCAMHRTPPPSLRAYVACLHIVCVYAYTYLCLWVPCVYECKLSVCVCVRMGNILVRTPWCESSCELHGEPSRGCPNCSS